MFQWKITGIRAKDGLITEASYHVTLTDEDLVIETEGHWQFGNPVEKVPFDKVTEETVIEWLKKDAIQFGKNVIESALTDQLERLKAPKVLPPWVPQVFSLGE